MYLSRVLLNLNNRNTMWALASANRFHGALESCFPGERKRRLWRIDRLNGNLYFLILSEEKPDLSSFCLQFSESENAWETKDYTTLLGRIENGSEWHFRLTANPTKSLSSKKRGKRGKVCAHITTEYQKKWLVDRMVRNGFEISENSFDVVQSKWLRFYKKDKRTVTLLSVTYEGVLKITDEELFRNALVNGIGRGKAYGMGLITVIRK